MKINLKMLLIISDTFILCKLSLPRPQVFTKYTIPKRGLILMDVCLGGTINTNTKFNALTCQEDIQNQSSYQTPGIYLNLLSQPNSTSTQVGSDKVIIWTTPPHHPTSQTFKSLPGNPVS